MAVTEGELTAAARARVGTVLRGKYRLDRVLGVGGMAVVYAATHRNRQEFALKLLHPQLSIREDVRTRFLREGYVANSVKHRGAVAVLDDDVAEDGSAFLVMELLRGASVDELWQKHGQRLPLRVVLALAYQLLDVLAAAHAKSIVHRDIKPANLFLTREGVVKVLDFGIARLRDAASNENATHTGILLGTPAFMAPEQAMAESKNIDGQTDLWAVGATMFRLISGETVHPGENPQQIMIKAATTPARSLATAAFVGPPHGNGPPPPVVIAVVDRALAFEKSARFPSAGAMRDAVREAYASCFGEPVTTAPLVGLFEGDETAELDETHYAGGVATPIAEVPSAFRVRGTQVLPRPGHAAAVPAVTSPHRDLGASGPAAWGPTGGTTAQPVSRHPTQEPVSLPLSKTVRWALPLAAGLGTAVLAVLGYAGYAALHRSAREPPAGLVTPATPSAEALPPVPSASTSQPAPVAPVPSASVAAAASATTTVAAPPAEASSTPPHGSPARSRGGHKSPPTQTTDYGL